MAINKNAAHYENTYFMKQQNQISLSAVTKGKCVTSYELCFYEALEPAQKHWTKFILSHEESYTASFKQLQVPVLADFVNKCLQCHFSAV